MMFKDLQMEKEAEVHNDYNTTADMFDVPPELITPTNPNEEHQDEPADPVTE